MVSFTADSSAAVLLCSDAMIANASFTFHNSADEEDDEDEEESSGTVDAECDDWGEALLLLKMMLFGDAGGVLSHFSRASSFFRE